ncbi:type 1 glutamine amidotransferase [Methanolobus sp. ZRKC3]|uniref:type 1 glutamine amidotransferase n=1 Tax=Methanolobus sp. ZRKC3 TaxID=3125786 RepID=UPI003251428F
MKVLIIKNISREGPGILKNVLDENDIHYDMVDLDSKETIPDPQAYSAVFIFGGPDSANDETDKMKMELETIKKTIENKIPYLGICLGMQALVKACGEEIRKNEVQEIGWKGEDDEYFTIDILDEKKDDHLFSGLKSPLKIFHLHGETVILTDDMELMATGKYCRNQIVKIGTSAYGFQGHFELTPEMFEEWMNVDTDLKMLDRNYLMNDFEAVYENYQQSGRKLFTNFLMNAGLL